MSDAQPSNQTTAAAPQGSPTEPAALSNGTATNNNAPATATTTTTQGGDTAPTQPAIDHSRQMHSLNMNSAHADATVSAADSYAFQMGRARAMERNGHTAHQSHGNSGNQTLGHGGGEVGFGPSGSAHDDYDPDSNVYVANLPSDYGKERLYQLFAAYGNIVRYKFVQPDEASQPGYGFVQFAQRKDAHKAIKNLEGHVFATGESIYLSIALRRRSSLSDEPTNLYVKNLPSGWTNERLRKVFGVYGQIRQSKVVGDGIAFVRFEDHEQALNAIGRLDKMSFPSGHGGPPIKLEVRFATRKTAANAYRLQQVPSANKANENNLYIRNLPKYYNQSSLETLFANYGKISSAKINDNGIAFVRFAHAEDARRAIAELNGKKPPQFEEEMVVKLAHFDIGDSRNRWAQKFPPSMGGHGGAHGGQWHNQGHHNHHNQGLHNQWQRNNNGHGSHAGGHSPHGQNNGNGHHNHGQRNMGGMAPGPGRNFNNNMYQNHQFQGTHSLSQAHGRANAQNPFDGPGPNSSPKRGLRSPNAANHANNGHHGSPNGAMNGSQNGPSGGVANGSMNGVHNGAHAMSNGGAQQMQMSGMNVHAVNAVNGMGAMNNMPHAQQQLMNGIDNQHTLQALQQQMNQWSMGNATAGVGNVGISGVNGISNMNVSGMTGVAALGGVGGVGNTASPLTGVGMTQFAFPNNMSSLAQSGLGLGSVGNMSGLGMSSGMPGMLNSAPNLFGTPNASQPQQASLAQLGNATSNPLPVSRSSNQHQHQGKDGMNSTGSENESPSPPNGSNGANGAHANGMASMNFSSPLKGVDGAAGNSKTWSKKQQELGDKLYQKVFARTGGVLAPKITGMLIKMGDKKAQKCIDDEAYLLEQIHVAKQLLLSQDIESVSSGSMAMNTNLAMPVTPTNTTPSQLLSPLATSTSTPSLTSQLAGIANTQMARRFQALNTSLGSVTTPHKAGTPTSLNPQHQAGATGTPTSLATQPINLFAGAGGASLTQQLTSANALFPGAGGVAQVGVNGLNGMVTSTTGVAAPSLYQQLAALNTAGSTASPKPPLQKVGAAPLTPQQQQFLFTTIPNLGSASNPLSSLANTPGSVGNVGSPSQAIQQSGWGLANGMTQQQVPGQQQQQQQQAQANGQQQGQQQTQAGNVIQTHTAPTFMQPALFPRTQ